MKNDRIDLHTNTGRHMISMAFFTLLSSVLFLLIILSVQGNLRHLTTLEHSTYLYSATAHGSIDHDYYYQFDASIGFSSIFPISECMNADVVMQGKGSEYTDLVSWNTSVLQADEIAITAGIAEKYSLSIGSHLYSRHIVDSTNREYKIAIILPETTATRLSKRSSTEGVIIMGYDELYVVNIIPHIVAFTVDDVGNFQSKYKEMPENLLYREDEIALLKSKIVPFYILMLMFSCVLPMLFVLFGTRDISRYFRRLASLGFGRARLNKSFCYSIIGSGFISISMTAIMSLVGLFLIGNQYRLTSLLMVFVLVEMLALIIIAMMARNRIWRT